MVNFSSIIILLQMVVTLLTNPTTASNPQVQLIAQQAISMATAYLQSIPIVETPLGIGMGGPIDSQSIPETQSVVQPTIQPSCNLQATFTQNDPPRTIISWELTGIPDTVRGKISDTTSTFSNDGDTGFSMIKQGSGPYPNQNTTVVPIHFQYGVQGDFNGTKCWVYPANN